MAKINVMPWEADDAPNTFVWEPPKKVTHPSGMLTQREYESVTSDMSSWIWGTLQGSFNEKMSISQILVDALIGMVPLVGDATAIRDIVAICCGMYNDEQKLKSAMEWAMLVILLLALIPVAGGVVKGIGHLALKLTQDLMRESEKVLKLVNDIIAFMNRVGLRNAKVFFLELRITKFYKQIIEKADLVFSVIQLTVKRIKTKMGRTLPQGIIEGLDKLSAGIERLKKVSAAMIPQGIKEVHMRLCYLQAFVYSGGHIAPNVMEKARREVEAMMMSAKADEAKAASQANAAAKAKEASQAQAAAQAHPSEATQQAAANAQAAKQAAEKDAAQKAQQAQQAQAAADNASKQTTAAIQSAPPPPTPAQQHPALPAPEKHPALPAPAQHIPEQVTVTTNAGDHHVSKAPEADVVAPHPKLLKRGENTQNEAFTLDEVSTVYHHETPFPDLTDPEKKRTYREGDPDLTFEVKHYQDVNTFHGNIINQMLSDCTLYRFFGPEGFTHGVKVEESYAVGGYWGIGKIPATAEEWRRFCAVLDEWNRDGFICMVHLPKDVQLPACTGTIAEQFSNTIKGQYLDGGYQQAVVAIEQDLKDALIDASKRAMTQGKVTLSNGIVVEVRKTGWKDANSIHGYSTASQHGADAARLTNNEIRDKP